MYIPAMVVPTGLEPVTFGLGNTLPERRDSNLLGAKAHNELKDKAAENPYYIGGYLCPVTSHAV